ncbi:MAG TPA: cytochrome c [Gaiellaceae bacterium]
MLLGLTTDQKLGLAGTAALFIAFALVSALLIPRYRPDFPGRGGVGLYVVVTLLLTVGMLGAVVVFAKEDEPAEAAEHGETLPTETETETGPPPATTAEEPPAGDPEAGRELFAANGCGACHALSAAGSTGAVGPNLDESLAGKDAEYVRRAIVDPNADVAEGYQPGVMPAFEQLSDDQVNDLVAFLLQG